MGEIADSLIDAMIDRHMMVRRSRRQGRSFQAGSGDYRWRDANGVTHSMWEMSESYLRAAIRVASETGNTGKLQQLREVLRSRQDPHRFFNSE